MYPMIEATTLIYIKKIEKSKTNYVFCLIYDKFWILPPSRRLLFRQEFPSPAAPTNAISLGIGNMARYRFTQGGRVAFIEKLSSLL